MVSEYIEQLIRQATEYPDSYEKADAFYKYGMYCDQTEKDSEYALMCWETAKEVLDRIIFEKTKATWHELDAYCFSIKQTNELLELYYEILKCESPYKFESFIFHMEKKRDPSKRFYEPRMETLKTVVEDLETVDSRKYKFYGLSMPSRVGKSTICIFFLAWVSCKRPNSHSAMGGHSGVLAKGFYKELMNFMTTEEYTFKELFFYMHPEYENKTFPTNNSAEDLTITLGDPDRFATITCRGIDGTWTGAIDVSWDGYLYVDDLVRDREHSLSPTRMENTFQEYLNKMVDRKSGFNGGALELMVGTLWNVLDPLERMKNMYGENPRYLFRRIPALNDYDESNFNYKINGFTTEYYRDMRERLDDAEWQSKYQQKPYVREGLLYPTDEFRYFNGILPEGDCRTVAVVDCAFGGGDSLSMPIGKEYDNGDVYIFDWVFNGGTKEITIPAVTGKIISNEIRQIRFEGNQGGDMYCDYVDKELRKQGYKCSCTSRKAPNNMAKVEKIIAYSGDIKRKFIFLQSKKPTPEELALDQELGVTRYVRNGEYQKAFDEMCSFVTIGKNVHDDAVDSITQLAIYLDNDGIKTAKIVRGII